MQCVLWCAMNNLMVSVSCGVQCVIWGVVFHVVCRVPCGVQCGMWYAVCLIVCSVFYVVLSVFHVVCSVLCGVQSVLRCVGSGGQWFGPNEKLMTGCRDEGQGMNKCGHYFQGYGSALGVLDPVSSRLL